MNHTEAYKMMSTSNLKWKDHWEAFAADELKEVIEQEKYNSHRLLKSLPPRFNIALLPPHFLHLKSQNWLPAHLTNENITIDSSMKKPHLSLPPRAKDFICLLVQKVNQPEKPFYPKLIDTSTTFMQTEDSSSSTTPMNCEMNPLLYGDSFYGDCIRERRRTTQLCIESYDSAPESLTCMDGISQTQFTSIPNKSTIERTGLASPILITNPIERLGSISQPSNYPDVLLNLCKTFKEAAIRRHLLHKSLSHLDLLYNSAVLQRGLGKSLLLSNVKKILSSYPTVILAGGANVGKSTLVNLLLGAKINPSGELPTTEYCIKLIYPPNPSNSKSATVRIKEWDGWDTQDPVRTSDSLTDISSLIKSATDSLQLPVPKTRWRYIQTEYPGHLLAQELNIIECPAIDGEKTYSEIEEMVRSHPVSMMIYMFDSSNLVSDKDKSFIRYIRGHFPNLPIFFLANKVDVDMEAMQANRVPQESFSLSTSSSAFSSYDSKRTPTHPVIGMSKNRLPANRSDRTLESECADEEADRINEIQASLEINNFLDYSVIKSTKEEAQKEIQVINFGPMSTGEVFYSQKYTHMFNDTVKAFDNFVQLSLQKMIIPIQIQISVMVKALIDASLEYEEQRENLDTLRTYLSESHAQHITSYRNMIQNISGILYSQRGSIVDTVTSLVTPLFTPNNKLPQNWTSFKIESDTIDVLYNLFQNKNIVDQINQERLNIEINIRDLFKDIRERSNRPTFTLLVDILETSLNAQMQQIPPIQLMNLHQCLTVSYSESSSSRLDQFTRFLTKLTAPIKSPHQIDANIKPNIKQMCQDVISRFTVDKMVKPFYDDMNRVIVNLGKTIKTYLNLSRNSYQTKENWVDHLIQIYPSQPKGKDASFSSLMGIDMVLESLRQVANDGFPRVKQIAPNSATCDQSSTHNFILEDKYGDFAPKNIMIRKKLAVEFSQLSNISFIMHCTRFSESGSEATVCRPKAIALDYEFNFLYLLPAMSSDLFLELTNENGTTWTFEEGLHIGDQVAKAFKFIEKSKLRVWDLRPENILVRRTETGYQVKLLVLELPNKDKPYPNNTGPFHYLPENVASKSPQDYVLYRTSMYRSMTPKHSTSIRSSAGNITISPKRKPYTGKATLKTLLVPASFIYSFGCLFWWIYTRRLTAPPPPSVYLASNDQMYKKMVECARLPDILGQADTDHVKYLLSLAVDLSPRTQVLEGFVLNPMLYRAQLKEHVGTSSMSTSPSITSL